MNVDKLEITRRIEKFRDAIHRTGAKLTHQRLIIFREVASSLAHPDAETIFKAVRKEMPSISLDTVYRTLSFLSDLGVITPLSPSRERLRFDANLARHHHYVCLECGQVMDFESVEMNSIPVPKTVTQLGSIVTTHVEVRGICSDCSKTHTEKSVKTKKTSGRERSRP